MAETRELTEADKRLRTYLVIASGLLFSVILITLFYCSYGYQALPSFLSPPL